MQENKFSAFIDLTKWYHHLPSLISNHLALSRNNIYIWSIAFKSFYKSSRFQLMQFPFEYSITSGSSSHVQKKYAHHSNKEQCETSPSASVFQRWISKPSVFSVSLFLPFFWCQWTEKTLRTSRTIIQQCSNNEGQASVAERWRWEKVNRESDMMGTWGLYKRCLITDGLLHYT